MKPSEANVFDVARYILEKCGKMTCMKLQKLVYYCQAWSLVWDERPMFPEAVRAWANGPVVKELYAGHKGWFEIDTPSLGGRGKTEQLDEAARDTIDGVIKHYGNYTSQQLSELTHEEAPWKHARKGLKPGERGDQEIPHADMAEYYSSLL